MLPCPNNHQERNKSNSAKRREEMGKVEETGERREIWAGNSIVWFSKAFLSFLFSVTTLQIAHWVEGNTDICSGVLCYLEFMEKIFKEDILSFSYSFCFIPSSWQKHTKWMHKTAITIDATLTFSSGFLGVCGSEKCTDWWQLFPRPFHRDVYELSLQV